MSVAAPAPASRLDRALLACAIGLIVLVAVTGVVGAIDLAGERATSGATAIPPAKTSGAAEAAPVAHTHALEYDVHDPEILLFDGEGHDAPIAGVSYLVSGPDPAGFTGKWDVWHRHEAVCFAGGLVIAEVGGHPGSRIDMTREECTARKGIIFPIANLTMLHVWMKPGFESTAGVFSHDHPALYG